MPHMAPAGNFVRNHRLPTANQHGNGHTGKPPLVDRPCVPGDYPHCEYSCSPSKPARLQGRDHHGAGHRRVEKKALNARCQGGSRRIESHFQASRPRDMPRGLSCAYDRLSMPKNPAHLNRDSMRRTVFRPIQHGAAYRALSFHGHFSVSHSVIMHGITRTHALRTYVHYRRRHRMTPVRLVLSKA